MSGKLRIWLWLSIILTIAGGVLLYPIGTAVLDVVFIVIKIGMLAGLAVLLFKRKKSGLYIWAVFCIGAVVMTIIKWNITGSASVLFIVSIIIDVCMPAGAYALIKKSPDGFR